MAKAKVVHSEDAVTIIFNGDKRYPEPSTGVIKFPGGHVEVSRTSDGQYWAHVAIDSGSITESRVDYDHETYLKTNGAIPPIPNESGIKHMAIKVTA